MPSVARRENLSSVQVMLRPGTERCVEENHIFEALKPEALRKQHGRTTVTVVATVLTEAGIWGDSSVVKTTRG